MKKPLIIDLINQYYLDSRQVGHTTLLITSAQSLMLPEALKPIVLCHNYMWAKEVKKRFGVDTATIEDLRNGKLKGIRRPLLIDNAVWFDIARETSKAIAEAREDGKNGRL